jgi:uridylate kinase
MTDRAGMSGPKYQRICLKLSGEALSGGAGQGLDEDTLSLIVAELTGIVTLGVQVVVVVGAGNIIRGMTAAAAGAHRVTGDYMGMLGTVINSLALQDAFERSGLTARVLSALRMDEVAESFDRRRAIHHLEKGRLVLLAAGTGRPFFTTDTAAALRAAETDCEILLKATKVDGVYSADPVEHPEARRYESLTHQQILAQNLRVMDATAATLCRENDIPIIVFNLFTAGNLRKAVTGQAVGTLITSA